MQVNSKYSDKVNDIPKNIKYAVIYCRKSCKSYNSYGNELSFSMQQDMCTEFCLANNLVILNIIHETTPARDMDNMVKLYDLLGDIKLDTLLVVSDITRFSRNVMQGLEIIENLLEKKSTIYAVYNRCCYNDNHFNRNQFRIFLNNAEFESDQIAERINRSLKHRRSIGSKIGRSRFGYSSYYVKGGIRKEKQNKREQNIILMIKKLRNSNNSTSEIVSILNNKGYNFRDKEWNNRRVKYVEKV